MTRIAGWCRLHERELALIVQQLPISDVKFLDLPSLGDWGTRRQAFARLENEERFKDTGRIGSSEKDATLHYASVINFTYFHYLKIGQRE